MKRKIKAIGIIFGVTALIAVLYFGIARLIENHMASELVGGSTPTESKPMLAYPDADGLAPASSYPLPV